MKNMNFSYIRYLRRFHDALQGQKQKNQHATFESTIYGFMISLTLQYCDIALKAVVMFVKIAHGFWKKRSESAPNVNKLSHLGHRQPSRIHWKADAPMTCQCFARISVKRHDWTIWTSMVNLPIFPFIWFDSIWYDNIPFYIHYIWTKNSFCMSLKIKILTIFWKLH